MIMLKVLLIDDEIYDAERMVRACQRAHLEIDHAENLAGGLEKLKDPYDVILLDLMLPDTGNGLESMKEIGRVSPEIPILIVSGSRPEPILAKLMGSAGALDWLPKPVRSAGEVEWASWLEVLINKILMIGAWHQGHPERIGLAIGDLRRMIEIQNREIQRTFSEQRGSIQKLSEAVNRLAKVEEDRLQEVKEEKSEIDEKPTRKKKTHQPWYASPIDRMVAAVSLAIREQPKIVAILALAVLIFSLTLAALVNLDLRGLLGPALPLGSEEITPSN